MTMNTEYTPQALDVLQTRLQTSLKQSPPNYENALSILNDVKEHISLIVHDSSLYAHWLRTWVPLIRDILIDVNVVKKKKDPKGNSKNEKKKTQHPLFIPPELYRNGVRKCLLDTLCKCPCNEGLLDYVSTLMSCCVNVLLVDYEENALLATNIIFQIFRANRMVLATASSTTSISRMKSEEAKQLRECQVFIEFVSDCYTELKKSGGSLEKNFYFSTNSNIELASTPSSTSSSSKDITSPIPARQSVRILSECPLTVTLLFQLYPKLLKRNIPSMIPVMMGALKLVPPKLVDSRNGTADTPPKGGSASTIPATHHTKIKEDSQVTATPKKLTDSNNTDISTPSAPSNELFRLYRLRAQELLIAQVKTLSFIVHVLETSADQMRPYEDALADNVIYLLKSCPREIISTRKELLQSTRRILATDFRRGFYRHMDIMLDERMIAGASKYSTIEQSLRPLGYSALADLIKHARSRMTPAQLGRAVRIYSRVMHDIEMNMPLALQATSARVLFHLVDPIYNNADPNPQIGRDLLVRILTAYVQKFRTIKEKIPELVEDAKKEAHDSLDWSLASKNIGAEEDGYRTSSIATLRDIQSFLGLMFQGMKNIIWCIHNYAQQREKEHQRMILSYEEQFPLPPSMSNSENKEVNSALLKMTNDERNLVSDYIRYGVFCLRGFISLGRTNCISSSEQHSAKSLCPRYREIVESFAASFSLYESGESSNIKKILTPNLPLIINELDTKKEFIVFFKHLLLASGKAVSYEVCDSVFTHLSKNIGVLSDFVFEQPEEKEYIDISSYQPSGLSIPAQTQFNLFILLFSSIAKYPTNEAVFLPHLRTFISDCIRRSMNTPVLWPGPFLCIIRVLFRTLTGGKLEASYKELMPLVPSLLNGFFRVYTTTTNDQLRLMIIELMLSIPARLSVLLPHLPLLIKVIIPALQTKRGDLINLSLRTLEFWVDNLHPDYIYPVLANDRDSLCALMVSLTKHLKPAPYVHGLLCLRLIGKLGGKNRLFLHEVMSQDCSIHKKSNASLSILVEWDQKRSKYASQDDLNSNSILLPLPLEGAIDVLKYVADAPHYVTNKDDTITTPVQIDLQDNYVKDLFNERAEYLDFNSYALQILHMTKFEQATSALAIVRGALAAVLDVSIESDTLYLPTCKPSVDSHDYTTGNEHSTNLLHRSDNHAYANSLKLICDGLFIATRIKELQEEAIMLLKGLGSHILFVIESHIDCFTRIDCDGTAVDIPNQTMFEQNHLSGGKLQSLQPFGCFRLSNPLGHDIDPFMFNESLADALSDSYSKQSSSGSRQSTHAALEVMKHIFELKTRIQTSSPMKSSMCNQVADIFAENLLSVLCKACFAQSWNRRSGLTSAIIKLLNSMGIDWSKKFEVEILHVAMFVVKDAPSEITIAQHEALKFFMTITWFFFGAPASWESNRIVYDILSTKSVYDQSESKIVVDTLPINKASLTLIISEIGSTNQLVRFAVRLFLRIVSDDSPLDTVFKDDMTHLKRLVFPRILRNSPLPDQVAIVESIAFMIDRAPSLFSLKDPTCMSFTAELLKMLSVADGEISDTISSVVLINKNGFTVEESPNHHTINRIHASSVFLRKSFNLKWESFNGCVIVPEELPLGVQLRVSSIYLFRSIVRQFPTDFFGAQAKTQIGNLRPHIMSLLFRSLISDADEVVSAAESALHDTFLLGFQNKEENPDDSSKSSPRLQKELIQACIRPILMNLKDHTKLTLSLLKGVSRLLVLLTSWFNKNLGEKMIEHLHKFTEADQIIELQIWKRKDEPKIAAAVLGLFSLLPQASRFVESLVKATIRLEKAWNEPVSSFREPLARYLNQHVASAVGFFIEEHRLGNPEYSELFIDILQRDCSIELRKYMNTKESFVMLLNVCFERPLAIIRSEKNGLSSPASKSNSLAYLESYGLNPMNSYTAQRKLEAARFEIMSKKKQFSKIKRDNKPNSQQRIDFLKRELDSARTAYLNKISQTQVSSQNDRLRMTINALELQQQGLEIVAILVKYNDGQGKLHEENNDVFRALRWLWRSRGRHYRLLNEDDIHPRHCQSETLLLTNFLISYSKSNPADIEVLFDFIRIFLGSTSIDFTFVKEFIYRRVTRDLSTEQKEQVLERYAALLSNEGSEDNKIMVTSVIIVPMLKHSLQTSSPASINAIISATSIKQILESIFYRSPLYNSKLIYHYLELINVLLEHLHEDISDYRKDMMKYIWSILKSDEGGTLRCCGYLAVSRFVVAFETPAKVVLQVYRALLRSHSTQEQSMVRTALNLLVPSLPKRLSSDELENAFKYTTKVIQEEGSSLQQLSHVIGCITCHPDVYSGISSILIPQMVHALSLFEISQNVSSELKELCIVAAKLIIEWSKRDTTPDNTAPDDGLTTDSTIINQHILDVIVNFLVKIIISNAEMISDASFYVIHNEATTLLKSILTIQPHVNMSDVHFERLFALGLPTEKLLQAKRKGLDFHKDINATSKEEEDDDHDDKSIASIILASLDIASALLACKSMKSLMRLNPSKLISSAFSHGPSIMNKDVQNKLKAFIVNLFASRSADLSDGILITLLEDSIVAVANTADKSDETNQRRYFAIDIIEAVCISSHKVIESFVISLTSFIKEEVKRHVQEVPRISTSLVTGDTSASNIAPATPTLGLFELACGFDLHASKNKDITSYKTADAYTLLEVEAPKSSLKALIQSFRLISTSSIMSSFSVTRKTFLEASYLLLEYSTSVPLIMTIISILGTMIITNDDRDLMTQSEMDECVLRFAQLDFSKLPTATSQILYDMICSIFLSLYEYPSRQKRYIVERRALMEKVFPMCLMSGNESHRSMALRMFAMDTRDCDVVQQKMQSFAEDADCKDKDCRIFSIPDICPIEIIRRFLCADLEYLGKRMWTVALVDLLLLISKHDGRLNPKQRCHLRLRQYLDSENIRGVNLKDISSVEYMTFVERISFDLHNGKGRCISAIRNIVRCNIATNQSILECCFQAVWQHLASDEDRVSLVNPLEKLLAAPYHTQFLKSNGHSNVVQSLLQLVFRLRPIPMIDTLLLSSLAMDYNMHYEVLAYLEKQYLALQRNGFGNSEEISVVLQRIYSSFSSLGDRDVTIAISSAMCELPGTKFALSLDMYGAVKKSADAYLAISDRADVDKQFMPSKPEVNLWTRKWIDAQKELSQWPQIDELSTALQDSKLMLESAWKTRNWDNVKSLQANPSVIASLEIGDLVAKMTEIFLGIHEGKFADSEKVHAQMAQLCLYKWCLLPEVKVGSGGAHFKLYQQFHRLVELRESSQLILESHTRSSRRSLPDFKSVLVSWRHRTPNAFEPLSTWDDLFSWRLYTFDTIANIFNWTESSNLAMLHDRPVATITLGRIARKQDLNEISMSLLNELTDCMDVTDAFLKLREQIVTYQQSPDDTMMLKGGLNLVNSANLTYFSSLQKAELFRLKSYFFNAMNDKSNAHKTYCHTVQIDPNYARAWIDWGNLCASLPTNNTNSNHSEASKRNITIKYLAQAMGCYLEAIRCDTSEKSRDNIPHCIWMLSNDSPQYGHLIKAFEARAPLLPAWVWLPFIPQLLTSLHRVEAKAVHAVLTRIVSDHPQALYYSLRAFFLERRDIERSKDQNSDSKHEDGAQKKAEVLMTNLRKLHPVLWGRLEAILEDLIIRFRPSYESELLATIKALLEKAKIKIEDNEDKDSETTLVETLHGNLSKISQKFFNKEKSESSKGRKTLLFEKKWRAAFDHDFIEQQKGPDALDTLVAKLEDWKSKLEHQGTLVPSTCQLQETSPSLSWYSCQSSNLWAGACDSASLALSNSLHDDHLSLDNALYEATQSSAVAAHKISSESVVSIAKAEGMGGHEGGGSALVEIPGQYAPTSSNVLDTRPFPELHAKLVHFHQTLEVISSPSKQDQMVRQITMIGSDGKTYKFLLQLAIPYWTRTDEKSAQLQYIMGKVLRRDIQTCRRGLTVRPNVVIPVAQRMRMTANESSYTSLDSVFHHIKATEATRIASFFDEEVAKRLARTDSDSKDPQSLEKVKLDTYRHICQELVPSNILSQYMTGIIQSIEQLMQYRKVFASQLALNSVLQHAFAVIDRTPSRFVFCNSSGRVLTQDFRIQYNQGLFEAHHVPFRMTRTIVDFIGPFLLEGTFIPAFVSASSAMHAKRTSLEPILHLLLRDDIISWYTSKTQPRNDKKTQEMEHQLSERVRKNVGYVQKRLEECSVRHVENAAEEAISENPQPVDVHVRNLVTAATNEEKLCLMSSTYQAWL